VSYFRDVPDGPLGEGVRTPNLGKNLQCMGYCWSGPYIIGMALCRVFSCTAGLCTYRGGVDIYPGWLVWQHKEPCKKVPANLELPYEIWLCRGPKPLTSITMWTRSEVHIGSPIFPLLF
jgi:hypothetical protein